MKFRWNLNFNPLQHVDPIQLSAKIPNESLRRRALDVLMTVSIPFNRWLGFRFEHIGEDRVVVLSPPRKLRENHVGGAHACSLALMGEYAAGACIATHYGLQGNRLIIGKLEVDYHRQGRGWLRAEAHAPAEWPQPQEGEAWLDMVTKITDSKNVEVATCKTRWQLKSWSRVRQKTAE
ncbi:MAG: DUF4442 domain-containing protein [Bdellovibrionaceae bacterium]|nr:DUF4442 domain-containing protein [Pseudobdellovibrionaceae bacterium]